MQTEWFFSVDEVRYGPVTGQQLKQAANRGDLGPADLVWTQGWIEWHRASSIPWLIGPNGPIVQDGRGKGRSSPPPLTSVNRDATAVLIECKDCGRDHFVDCGPCPSAQDAAREVAMVERMAA